MDQTQYPQSLAEQEELVLGKALTRKLLKKHSQAIYNRLDIMLRSVLVFSLLAAFGSWADASVL